MLHVAMFDAINSIEERYQPYRVNVRASHGASSEVAAAQAAHDVLAALIPGSLAAYDAELAETVAGVSPGRAAQGARVGKKVAEEILAWRQNDGWTTAGPAYLPPLIPGWWQPTPPNLPAAGFTNVPAVTPFALLTATQFTVPPPPFLTSAQYAADLNYVKAIGKSNSTTRTGDQTLAAQLWAGVTSVTTTGLNALWNNIARDTTTAQGKDLLDTARIFALMNASMHDGIQTSQTGKYIYGFWRPVTAIRAADTDLNAATDPDPTWLPLLTTPPYPSYPGNMACIGASAATALRLGFGTDDIAFSAVWKNANSTMPDHVRSYAGFWEAALEEGFSREWGGIHYPFDTQSSQIACPKVSQWVFDHFMERKHFGWPW
jgi:membrane-associated phospholipid phosphatase